VGAYAAEATQDAVLASILPGQQLRVIKLDLISPAREGQVRQQFDEERLGTLADSLKRSGVREPIIVTPHGASPGCFQIVAGERRWRAAQLAGLREVPVLVKAVPDQAALALSLIENIQREDLNPLEEAQGLQRLIAEFGLTHDEAAQAVGRSRSAVSNLLRLTQLAKPVQDYLLRNALEMGHARALLSLPAAQQTSAAARVVDGKLSVRDTERLVHRLADTSKRTRGSGKALDADTQRLENDLAERLGASVRIEPGRNGTGRIVIRYASLEQLDGLLAKMR
jgi:ParB family chromosome partitioning protein